MTNFPTKIKENVAFFTVRFFYLALLVALFIPYMVMNAKKNSKLEREDKSNGNPLLHHGIYFFFHENFTINIQNDSLVFAVFVFLEK